jgi:deazaflavin-dependent oxidoreductase (nitroreductase family)
MSSSAGPPHVDPGASTGPLTSAWVALLRTRVAGWLFCTPAVAWLSRNILWKVDPPLMALTRGRIGSGLVLPTALLETRGARTGRPRRNAVIYFHDGDRVTIVASKFGAPEDPSWYHNLRAHPDVRFGGAAYRAEVVADEPSRDRLWRLADRVFPVFAAYRVKAARSGRTIPLVQLVRR